VFNLSNFVDLSQGITTNDHCSSSQVNALSPAALAYLGDAVYELKMRAHHLTPPSRMQDYHGRVVADVRAEAQAACARQIFLQLTEAEQVFFKKGRNAATNCPKRLPLETYQQATALETLIGYLYLTNPVRLQELLQWCVEINRATASTPEPQ
jgi:ribonuclease III family protein